jgi:hypothetical protein
MAHYFRSIPDIDYISRFPNAKLSEYVRSKNLFTRVKIRDEIFQNIMYFTKYSIVGDERPDNVANSYYGDPTFDWVVLLSNNIVNVYDEWPLTQQAFDTFLLEKYGTYDKMNQIHHYESEEVVTSTGTRILEKGLTVPANYSVTFFDAGLGREVTKTNITDPVTNLDYETKLEEAKRNIYLIKEEYLNMVVDDLINALEYKEGSTQFVSETLKRVDNIRLFQ